MGSSINTLISTTKWSGAPLQDVVANVVSVVETPSRIAKSTSASTTVAQSASFPRMTAYAHFTTLVVRHDPKDPSRTLLSTSSVQPSTTPSHIALGTRPIKESAAIGITFLIVAIAVVLGLLAYFLWRRRSEGTYPFKPRRGSPQDIIISKEPWLYDSVPSPALSQVPGESDGLIPVSVEMTAMPAHQSPPPEPITKQDPNLLSPLTTPRLSGARFSGPNGPLRASELVLGGAWTPPPNTEKNEERQPPASFKENR